MEVFLRAPISATNVVHILVEHRPTVDEVGHIIEYLEVYRQHADAGLQQAGVNSAAEANGGG